MAVGILRNLSVETDMRTRISRKSVSHVMCNAVRIAERQITCDICVANALCHSQRDELRGQSFVALSEAQVASIHEQRMR